MIKDQRAAPPVLRTLAPAPPKRSIPFLMVVGLFGLGLGFTINILDPFIYTEKIRLLAPPTLKNTLLGFLTIMTLLVALVVQPFIGWLSDRTRSRWGKRTPYLIAGTIGLSLSLFFIVGANSLGFLMIAAMSLSAFSNTLQGAWQALVPDRVPESQRGSAAGIKTLLELIGIIAGVAVVGMTLARGNMWGAPLAAVGLFTAILLITLLMLGRTEETTGQPVEVNSIQQDRPVADQEALLAVKSKTKVSTGEQSRNGTLAKPDMGFTPLPKRTFVSSFLHQMPAPFLWWMLNRFLFWSASISIRTFILNYMEDVLLIPPTEAQILSSRLFVVLGLGVFLLALPAGAIADRIGRRPLLVVAGLMAAGGAILIVLMRELPFLFAAGGLIAMGAGIFASASWALATDLAPRDQGAHYLGLANVATVLGSITGRLGGPLIDGVNQMTGTSATGYLLDFGLAAVLFVASSLVVLKIPKR